MGAAGCKLEATADGTGSLYIATLGVLAPYRGLGVGAEQPGKLAKLSFLSSCISGSRKCRHKPAEEDP